MYMGTSGAPNGWCVQCLCRVSSACVRQPCATTVPKGCLSVSHSLTYKEKIFNVSQVLHELSHLGSAIRLGKRLNEIVAFIRPLKRTGYKNEFSYGFKPSMATETTNSAFQKKIVYVSSRKKLEPYRPNAPRNRPKDSLTNVAGKRHRLHPCIQHEKYRGSSVIKFNDGDPDSFRPWKTTNQVFAAACAQVQNTTGLTNSGISASIAKTVHRKQRVYGK